MRVADVDGTTEGTFFRCLHEELRNDIREAFGAKRSQA